MSLCEYKYRNMSYGGITGAPVTGVQPLKYQFIMMNIIKMDYLLVKIFIL